MADVLLYRGRAVLWASLAAGPIAIVTIAVGALSSGQPLALDASAAAIVPMLGGAIGLSLVASIVAFLPNLSA